MYWVRPSPTSLILLRKYKKPSPVWDESITLRGATQFRQNFLPFLPRLVGQSLRFRKDPYTPAPKMSFPSLFAQAFSLRPALWKQQIRWYCFFILAFDSFYRKNAGLSMSFAVYFLMDEPPFLRYNAIVYLEVCTMVVPGLYYQNHYYALTGGTLEELINVTNTKVQRLTEKKCITPYFISEYSVEDDLLITEPEKAVPLILELMPEKEYNDRLRKILPEYCEGCRNFKPLTPRDSSLNGHHEEISLNRVCFYRREQRLGPRCFTIPANVMRVRIRNDAQNAKAMLKRGITERLIQTTKTEINSAIGWMPEHVEITQTPRPEVTVYASGLDYWLISYLFGILKSEEWGWKYTCICDGAKEIDIKREYKRMKKLGIFPGTLYADSIHEITDEIAFLEDSWLMQFYAKEDTSASFLMFHLGDGLKAWRYHSPILEKYHSSVCVDDYSHSRKFTISFEMEQSEL